MPTVVFDVIGTLFSLNRLRDALGRLGAPGPTLELWFGQSLRDYFAYSHAGGYVPLRDVLQAALPRALSSVDVRLAAGEAEAVVAKMSELDLAPGGGDAIATLRDAGHRLVALSNGSLDSTRALLERAGVAGEFAAVRSCDEIEISKPAAEAYELAREAANGEPIWMLAAHAWDTAGAGRAGFRTAWVAAVENEYLSAYPAPEVRADDLARAAREIVAR